MTENFAEKVRNGCTALNIDINENQLEQLYLYYTMLIEKNKVMNLTAITDEDEVILKHIIDSLSLVKCPGMPQIISGKRLKMIDIGTGAGLPGMILKIVYPDLEAVLFDSLKKRLVFLDEVIAALKLQNISTLHGRAEDFGKNKSYREQFDLAVSRAVANMSSLSEYCIPFVKKNGFFAAYKSADSADEIKAAENAVKKLGGKIASRTDFELPGSDIKRKIVIVEKTRNTPPMYPRKAGVPAKEPIQ